MQVTNQTSVEHDSRSSDQMRQSAKGTIGGWKGGLWQSATVSSKLATKVNTATVAAAATATNMVTAMICRGECTSFRFSVL